LNEAYKKTYCILYALVIILLLILIKLSVSSTDFFFFIFLTTMLDVLFALVFGILGLKNSHEDYPLRRISYCFIPILCCHLQEWHGENNILQMIGTCVVLLSSFESDCWSNGREKA